MALTVLAGRPGMLARQARSAARSRAQPAVVLPAGPPRRVARVVAFREEDAKKRTDKINNDLKHDLSAKDNSTSKDALRPLDASAPRDLASPEPPAGGAAAQTSAFPMTAVALAAIAAALALRPQQAMEAAFGWSAGAAGVLGAPIDTKVARLLAIGLGIAAATNVAESRAGGRAGGFAEPVLEADTSIRLDRSLAAYGLVTLCITALAFSPLAPRYLPGWAAGASALVRPAAAAALACVSALQWWVAGLAGPIDILKGLARELLGTPTRANNFNAATYALLGATFVAAGVGYIVMPHATLSLVFGRAAAAAAGPGAALMWQLAGAGFACCAGGACYTLKEAASFRDLTESKFKWLNFGLAAGALGHVLVLLPLVMGECGPLAPVLLAAWGLTMLMGAANAAA